MKEGTHTAQDQEALRQDTLTSKTVSSQKVRPEAASVSLPAFSGVGQEGRGSKEKTREKLLICILQPRSFHLSTRKGQSITYTLATNTNIRQIAWGKKMEETLSLGH